MVYEFITGYINKSTERSRSRAHSAIEVRHINLQKLSTKAVEIKKKEDGSEHIKQLMKTIQIFSKVTTGLLHMIKYGVP